MFPKRLDCPTKVQRSFEKSLSDVEVTQGHATPDHCPIPGPYIQIGNFRVQVFFPIQSSSLAYLVSYPRSNIEMFQAQLTATQAGEPMQIPTGAIQRNDERYSVLPTRVRSCPN